MSPNLCRAARAWLVWTQLQLADKAGVSLSTVREFEADRRTPTADQLKAIRRAFKEHRVLNLGRDWLIRAKDGHGISAGL